MPRAIPLAFIAIAFTCANAGAQVTIGGKPYTRLESRAATREAMLKALGGSSAEWGRWFAIGPFDHPKGGKDIAAPYPPERELASMKPGGPGPDLKSTFDGKGGVKLEWREAEDDQSIGGDAGFRVVNLEKSLEHGNRAKNAIAYLYRQITAPAQMSIPVSAGSDDGLRLWVNGKLTLDVNAERALDAQADRFLLKLEPGVNHIFAKVSQGAGEWSLALTPDQLLDPTIESALAYQLDLDFPTPESRFYSLVTVPVPAGIVAEVGGVDVLPSGDPVLCTRRGDVFTITGAYDLPPTKAVWKRIASGLQEPLGVAVRPSGPSFSLYTAQRSELTRLTDETGDGIIDLYATACDAWQISGNYHEYAFGPKFDSAGNAIITLNLAHTSIDGTVMGAPVPTRGWAVSIAPDGSMTKLADGLRSPDGIGFYSDGQPFYTDNQGDYVATNKLSPLYPGSFHGHQSTLKFREGYGPDWKKDGKPVPDITYPAVWFPYKKMGQSASDILLDSTNGKFGPFSGQLFIGEQTLCTVMRVSLEKLTDDAGHTLYQGACYPFREGFLSGVHRLCFAPDGSMLIGMTDRGWGSTGPKRFGLQRLIWTGEIPFEIKEMKVTPGGFSLEFTRDVDDTALGPAHYAISSYTYEYHPDYGSSEMDPLDHTITAVRRTGPRTIVLTLDQLRSGGVGYVHELTVTNLRAGAEPLLHTKAYYTLHRAPPS